MQESLLHSINISTLPLHKPREREIFLSDVEPVAPVIVDLFAGVEIDRDCLGEGNKWSTFCEASISYLCFAKLTGVLSFSYLLYLS